MKKTEIILAMCVILTLSSINVQASEKPLKYEDTPIILSKENIYEKNGEMLMLDKDSLSVVDVHKNALEIIIRVMEIKNKNIIKEKPIKFLIPAEDTPSVYIKSKWVSINEKEAEKFKKAIPIIKEELGRKEKREIFLKQIEYIVKQKEQNKKKQKEEETSVKIHGQVLTDKELEEMKKKEQENKKKNENDFVITITETPTVEITSNDDVQVEITKI